MLTGKMVADNFEFGVWQGASGVMRISLGHLWQVTKCGIISKEVNVNNNQL
jgi:hypothetical protein